MYFGYFGNFRIWLAFLDFEASRWQTVNILARMGKWYWWGKVESRRPFELREVLSPDQTPGTVQE
jgi:hypothetical protein